MKGRAGKTLGFSLIWKSCCPKAGGGNHCWSIAWVVQAPVVPAQAGVAAGWAREQAPAWWILAKFNSGCIPRVRWRLCNDTRAELRAGAWIWVRMGLREEWGLAWERIKVQGRGGIGKRVWGVVLWIGKDSMFSGMWRWQHGLSWHLREQNWHLRELKGDRGVWLWQDLATAPVGVPQAWWLYCSQTPQVWLSEMCWSFTDNLLKEWRGMKNKLQSCTVQSI